MMEPQQLDLFSGTPAPPPPPPPILVRAHYRNPGAPRPREKSGIELRDEALAGLEERRGEWLHQARLVALFIGIQKGRVSADDIDIPLPTGAHPNTRGGIFRSPWFVHTGYILSKRPERHANRISEYAVTALGRQQYTTRPVRC